MDAADVTIRRVISLLILAGERPGGVVRYFIIALVLWLAVMGPANAADEKLNRTGQAIIDSSASADSAERLPDTVGAGANPDSLSVHTNLRLRLLLIRNLRPQLSDLPKRWCDLKAGRSRFGFLTKDLSNVMRGIRYQDMNPARSFLDNQLAQPPPDSRLIRAYQIRTYPHAGPKKH